ncbi:MAG: hypothetical protein K2X56_19950 [Mycobacterium pseudokansasii]|uniref:Uncharacterized protein n=1 Tax=Mycobacterium pseudokansasii TaxID=2341080 RepID=A0A498QUG6_9MYCO|nr:hypothetical protein [Mycobacterium pseudokansasii]KZS62763.1 hypothetical protein A4G27_00885 [Mycobacterium kansasii]MBY0390297.1 hypothetical protein [Mycobacterium pseudokansasii]VAZ95818.1 hypothetical protein LAUMK35_03108 [Mycobacterium pseudokansasii]VAZ97154.1 hypothetical protein LAUMK21_03110 [Mycobacterium pseudokansasii]VBA51255.1 hypothetical protein LAUMK142_03012 [Mycobacterium pseudokansasii]
MVEPFAADPAPMVDAVERTAEFGCYAESVLAEIDQLFGTPGEAWTTESAARCPTTAGSGSEGRLRHRDGLSKDGTPHEFCNSTDGLIVDGNFYLPGSLPSYDELVELTKTDPDAAYYWSGLDARGVSVGPDGSRIAERLAGEANGTTLKMLLERNGMQPIPGWNKCDPELVRFWHDAARAYADNCSGTVTAVVGCDVRPDNIWQTVEVPRLTDNLNVAKIIQIDPDSRLTTVIFERYVEECSWQGQAEVVEPGRAVHFVETPSAQQ